MSIKIEIYGEDAGHALRELRDFAVGLQGRSAAIGIAEAQNFADQVDEVRGAYTQVMREQFTDEQFADQAIGTTGPTGSIGVPGVSTRERGKPGEGRARRTKAEIAEDKAADKADAERAAAAREAGIQTDSADDVKAAISTGEERVGPEDSEEDAAQDAADEAAEAAANKSGLTHDDLRQAVGRYQKKFGMAAAVAGVLTLLGCAIVEVPEADLEKAIAKIDNAVAGDAPGPVDDAPAATKADLIAAMKRYALKFDGQDTNMDAMPHTMTDCPTIFGMLFGPDAKSVSTVPVDGYAKAIAGIEEAIAKDPFKRGAK